MSLLTLWQAVSGQHCAVDSSDECSGALGKLDAALAKQPNTLQASQVLLGLCGWLRQQSDADLFMRGFAILERFKPVCCVDLLVAIIYTGGAEIDGEHEPVALLVASEPAKKRKKSENDEPTFLSLRVRAIKLLGRIGDTHAVVPLIQLLNEPSNHYRLRMAAAESLGRLGDTHAVDSLVGVLRNEDETSVYLRESSARALGMLGDLRAADALLEVLHSKKGLRNKMDFLKERVIQAIGHLFKEQPAEHSVVDSLVLALNDDAASIRQASAEAIGALGDPRWISVLMPRLLDPNPMVAEAVVASLYELGGEDALEDILTMSDLPEAVREDVASYLGDDDDEEDDWDDDAPLEAPSWDIPTRLEDDHDDDA